MESISEKEKSEFWKLFGLKIRIDYPFQHMDRQKSNLHIRHTIATEICTPFRVRIIQYGSTIKLLPHYYRFDSDMQIKDGSIPSQ